MSNIFSDVKGLAVVSLVGFAFFDPVDGLVGEESGAFGITYQRHAHKTGEATHAAADDDDPLFQNDLVEGK